MSHKHKRRPATAEVFPAPPDMPPVDAPDAPLVDAPAALAVDVPAPSSPSEQTSAAGGAGPSSGRPTGPDTAPLSQQMDESGHLLGEPGGPPPDDKPAPPAPPADVTITTAPSDAPAQPPRDSATIDPLEFPEHPFPGTANPRLNRFQAVVKRSILNAIHRHGATKTDVEVCGVLVGNVYHDRAGPFLYIQDIIRGDFAANNQAQVTFTHQTWEHIQTQMEAKHREQKIVGWYHTHPGFGIFLSKMDLFIHESFFNFPWQAAFVYDPKSGDEGMFLWKKGLAERDDFLVEEDWASAQAAEETPASEAAALPAADAAALTEIKTRLRRLERRHRFLIVMLWLLLLVAAAWPFVLYTIMSGGDFASMRRFLSGQSPPTTQRE